VGIILNKNIAGHRALEWMSDVVDEEIVAVAPTAHIKMLKRVDVIFPKRFVPQEMARVTVVSKAEGVFEHEKSERLLEDWSPVNFFVEAFRVLRRSAS